MTYANHQAEQDLLATILLNNDAFLYLPRYFRAEHFDEPLHQRIFATAKQMVDSGKTANPITLRSRFENDPALPESGAADYLRKLVQNAVVIHIPDICEVIQQAWAKRQIADSASQILATLLDDREGRSAEGLASSVVTRLNAIIDDTLSDRLQTTNDVMERVLDKLKNGFTAHSTGLPKLDTAMDGGIHPQRLYTFAARKKAGKTALAATFSHNLAVRGVSHVFITAEMSDEQIAQRILARMTGSFESAFRNDYGKSFEFQRRAAEAITEYKRCSYLEQAPGLTLADLQRLIPIYAAKGVSGFILDFWQCVGGQAKGESESKHLDEVAKYLAGACRKHGLWGIVMAQINQTGNTRGSEGIRIYSDQVYELHRPDFALPQAWLEMKDTRYTKWMNVGDEIMPGLMMNEHGPHFEQA